MPSKKEKKQMNYMAQVYGCVVCRREGHGFAEACIHHLRTGMGMGQRGKLYIPLCWNHHQHPEYGIHGGSKPWQEKYGTEMELLEYYNATAEEDYQTEL